MIIGNAVTPPPRHYLRKTGDTMSGDVNMDGHKVTGLAVPEATSDATNKKYVDSATANAEKNAKDYADGKATTKIDKTLRAADWVGTGPYTQPLSVAGLTEDKHVTAYPVYGDDTEENLTLREACGCVSFAKRSGGNVVFTCLEDKPAVDIPVVLEVYV